LHEMHRTFGGFQRRLEDSGQKFKANMAKVKADFEALKETVYEEIQPALSARVDTISWWSRWRPDDWDN